MAANSTQWYERAFGHSVVKCESICVDNSEPGNLTPIDSVVEGADVIGVFVSTEGSEFSKLVLNFYNNVNTTCGQLQTTRKKFEIIQVVSKDGFKDSTIQDLPWFSALSERRERLLRRYRIRDPSHETLVLLDAKSGDVITPCGLERIQGDPEGRLHPWTGRNVSQILREARFVNPRQTEVPYEHFQDTIKGLYFSAYWCPPCKAFTPQLADLYRRVNASVETKQLEVIFVSSDRSQESFSTYHSSMPWLAVAYEQEDIRRELATLLGVQGIPSLIVLDTDGQLITREGRAEVNDDALGKNFPWMPKSVNLLTERFAAKLHETPAVIIFIEGDADELDFAESVLTPAADKYRTSDIGPMLFLVGCDCDTSDVLREFVSLDDVVPLVALVDIPGNRFANIEEGTEITPQSVMNFVQRFIEETLPMQNIRATSQQDSEYISKRTV